ncbi:hypothetical protein [Aureimonas pseudogalii]|uniref:Uncharacterized protein n=1 Tax=Aureimonas pseudogalii TaxID=1744844 RepID=A0A7W6E9X7_9HYPH|nr:hypothetical protein [Aureimonas pseudogalii]MBB3997433.1 hypothetical protein [Aureimonas pseudogalii]
MFTQFANATCLAIEAQQVIWMRMAGLPRQGPLEAFTETGLMVSEKVEAACSAVLSLASGRSVDDVVSAYRGVVQANLARLSA